MMINTLAITSNKYTTTDHRQLHLFKTALYAKSFNFVDDTKVKRWLGAQEHGTVPPPPG